MFHFFLALCLAATLTDLPFDSISLFYMRGALFEKLLDPAVSQSVHQQEQEANHQQGYHCPELDTQLACIGVLLLVWVVALDQPLHVLVLQLHFFGLPPEQGQR